MCLRKRLLYYIGFLRRRWLRLPWVPLVRFVDAKSNDPCFAGIKMVGMRTGPEDRPKFIALTREALKLIQERDPRRFERIKREIRSITDVGAPWTTGSYDRLIRQCSINFERFNNTDDPELALQHYCCLLVHEATHGACYSRWINYTKAWRTRIEKLCWLEEARFARRAFPETSHLLIGDFDPGGWDFSWHGSRREKRKLTWPIMKDIFRHFRVNSTPPESPRETMPRSEGQRAVVKEE